MRCQAAPRDWGHQRTHLLRHAWLLLGRPAVSDAAVGECGPACSPRVGPGQSPHASLANGTAGSRANTTLGPSLCSCVVQWWETRPSRSKRSCTPTVRVHIRSLGGLYLLIDVLHRIAIPSWTSHLGHKALRSVSHTLERVTSGGDAASLLAVAGLIACKAALLQGLLVPIDTTFDLLQMALN